MEVWPLIAVAYKEESGEDVVWDEDNIHRNWTRKLCNNFKKPIGAIGENADCILCCIEIEWQIRSKTNLTILRASSSKDDDDL